MAEETDIIQRVLRGDPAAFKLLVERYQKRVIRMARSITGDGDTCEDLAQEVFLAAYSSLRRFDPARSRFSTWLFTIARNKSLNALKKRRPRVLGTLPEPVDDGKPYEDAARRELFAKLDRALVSLPASQRRAFVLVQFEGLAYEEAAQIEATRVGTIKSRVNRAKARLADALTRGEEED